MASPLTTKVIDAIPEWALTFLANGLGSYYRLNRYSLDMRGTLSEWRTLEQLNSEEIKVYQLERLRHIAKVANTTPYYSRVFREVGFDPYKINDLDDLNRLPYLSKDDLRQFGSEMLVPNYKAAQVERKSSGTTGQPVRFTLPRRMAFAQAYAMLYQFYLWFGFSALDRRATLAGRYMGQRPKGTVIRNVFENQLLLGVHALSESTVARYITALNKFAPKMFQAHPSALLMLKQFAERIGQSAPKIPLISYTGENMSENERQQLSKWLGKAMIFGTYGSGENVMAASECPELDGYHIHPAIGICELEEIDGKKEILGTSLLNDVMPMLRYRTGDLAENITAETCACGLCWPRLQGIQGRLDDQITSANGDLIAPVVLRTGIAALGLISSAYSIIQHQAPGHFTLLVYDDRSAVPQNSIDRILKYLRTTLGESVEIGVRFVPREKLFTARAKHRIVIKEKVQ
ncbi:phenylacetate--CoA ligase family protein [Kordiimonas lacus]|uniref:Phenylacetate-CoA ligase n=1 Tax=Kordiimonas lacus TaxID=637679 RepID=A0A1G6TBL2_9PROT|nr:phenylacetate--CoA ligase family protein [Kordiimonas lacus]SDD26409.1 phenylacetate-CoA ligase [Kordiimonas lacus]